MQLDSQTLDVLAVAGATAGGLALLLAVVALDRLRRLRQRLRLLQGRSPKEESFLDAVSRHIGEVEGLRADLSDARSQLETTRLDLADAIRHVAVVRFDAFADMGGRMSFAAALLDDAGDGLVITSINGRSETRTYAKGVKAGAGQQQLSPEEEQAITFARRSASAEGQRPDVGRRSDAAR